MIQVTKSVFIDQPLEKVFEFIADPANETLWQGDMVSAEKTSEGPLGVGSTARFVQRFLGMHLTNTIEITAFDPPHGYRFKATSGPVEFEGHTTCTAEDGGTRTTFVGSGSTSGLFRLLEPLVRRRLDQTLSKDLVKLKDLLEGHVVPGV